MNQRRISLQTYLFGSGLLLLAAGFMASRLLLSLGMILLVVQAVTDGGLVQRWRRFQQEPLLWALVLLWLIPLVSGIWSHNTSEWLLRLQIKLPLLLLPLALAVPPALLNRKWLVTAMICWLLLMVAGSMWSMVQYLQQQELLHRLYGQSKVIPTPAGNDHIRFAMGIIVALLFWLQLEWLQLTGSKARRWLLRLVSLWLVIYLHVAGVKTGLLGLYAVVFPLALWMLWKRGFRLLVAVSLGLICLLPLAAYQWLPTFKARLHYVLYDLEFWKQNQFTGELSDGNRILSVRSGWHTWQQAPLTGVGFGDVRDAVQQWYQQTAPQVPPANRFLPLNQWVMMGAGAGWPAVLLFTAAVVVLLAAFRRSPAALAFACFMTLVFAYESTLEDQLGVFVFTFFTLWWYLSRRILQ